MDYLTDDDELYTIVSQGDLSNELNTCLQSLPDIDKNLKFLYHRDNQQVTLLMLAALHGHDTVIRTILSHSSNTKKLVELTGTVKGIHGQYVSRVTALWCACDRSHYTVARTLIEVGQASVYHGPRNPLLIDAILSDRLDTIQFLIENGYVDINRTKEKDHPNYNSLMLSASRGQAKIVAYLLQRGAKVDHTTRIYHDTALGCAAIQGHLDTVQLLCSAGASTNRKNSDGETPLTLALKNNHLHVVEYLLNLIDNEAYIEELELLACSYIIPMRGINYDQLQFIKMVNLTEKILQMRVSKNFFKQISKPVAAYNFQQECQTVEEFHNIQYDNDRLCIEVLLIRERILTPKKVIGLCETLLIYGEKLIEQGDFEQCLYLWEHAFYLYQTMGHETSLHRFVWIFCKMIITGVFISPQLFVQICRLTLQPAEQNKKNHSIKNAVCLVTIAVKVLEQPAIAKTERQLIYQWINDLCHQQRTTPDGQTLLHLCVNDQTYRDINYRATEIKQVLKFPNFDTAQLLLSYGNRWIDLNAVDTSHGNTALHLISQSSKSDALSIINLLIDAGCHIDCLNQKNKTPFDLAKTIEIKTLLRKLQTPSLLKCFCARYIVEQRINYELIWPTNTKLATFIYLHGCIAKKNDID